MTKRYKKLLEWGGMALLSFIVLAAPAQKKKRVKVRSSTFGDVKPRQIGPATMSGRIAALDAVYSDPRILYVGAAGGGVWKSVNAGYSFKPVFDKHTQAIGAVRIDQAHPDTVWVGTGEPWTRNSTSVGDGVYKTVNGGDSWKRVGLENTERIGRIRIDPRDPNVVYVAALGHLWGPNEERGLFKTTDGGKSWTKILYVDENTGCADVDFDPSNPDILYAGMWQFRRRAWTFNSGGPGSGLYKSTDAGKTWTQLKDQLPEGEWGRVAVAVSPVDPTIVYALIEAEKSGLYRSKDKGANWELMNKSNSASERPFYFQQIVPDPVDTNRIYKPGFSLVSSKTGGKSFSGTGFGGGSVHSDHHALWIGKPNNKRLYLGTDGGVYVSEDKGNTWRLLRNLPVSQFYHVAVDDQKPYNVYGGLQDNGSWMAPSRSPGGIQNRDWKNVGQGDGFNCIPDKLDRNILYWQYQGGNVMRHNLKRGEYKEIRPFSTDANDQLRYNWNTPVHLSRDGKRLYIGAQNLYRSTNKGDSWEKISGDLTTNDPEKQKQEESGGLTIDNSTAENHCTIFTIAESPRDKNMIWVGTDDGSLQLTTDGGKTWEDLTDKVEGLPPLTWVSCVYPSPHNVGTAFVTFDGHRNDDRKAYVYKTTDSGQSWTMITRGVKAYCHTILQDPVNPDLLFLGTEGGLYVSVDEGKKWSLLKERCPKVSVRDMVFQERDRDLVVATHGRGIFILDDISPLRYLEPETLEKDVAFLETRPAVLKPLNILQEFAGDDEFAGRNYPQSAIISYYLKKRHMMGDLHLEIYNDKGEFVQKIPGGKRKGINKVEWQLRRKPPRVPSSPALDRGAIFGPPRPPGTYTVKLIKGDQTYESRLTILDDPDSEHSAADRAVQVEAVNRAYDLLEELAYTDRVAVDFMKQARAYAEDPFKGKDASRLKEAADQMEVFHKAMVETRPGRITGEVQMRGRISAVYGAMAHYDGKPTQAQLDRLKQMEQAFKEMEKKVFDLQESLRKSFAKKLEKKKLEWVPLSRAEFFEED